MGMKLVVADAEAQGAHPYPPSCAYGANVELDEAVASVVPEGVRLQAYEERLGPDEAIALADALAAYIERVPVGEPREGLRYVVDWLRYWGGRGESIVPWY